MKFQVIRCEVGEISKQDLELARQCNARVIGFGVSVAKSAKAFLKDYDTVKVNTSNLIYDLLKPLCQEYLDSIPDQYAEKPVGRSTVKKLFSVTVDKQPKTIAGCTVTRGRMVKGEVGKIRVWRQGKLIAEDFFEELRYLKDKVEEVEMGSDCGIRLRNFQDLQEKDELECLALQKLPKSMDWITEMVEKSRVAEAAADQK
jgi:translation initiation factor IF-2